MEQGNGLVQGISRISGKLILEAAKSRRAVVKIPGIFYFFQTDGVADKDKNAPVILLTVNEVVFSILCLNYVKCFPVGIAAFFHNCFPKKGGDIGHIFHEGAGFPKDGAVDSL